LSTSLRQSAKALRQLSGMLGHLGELLGRVATALGESAKTLRNSSASLGHLAEMRRQSVERLRRFVETL
jgi:hypothetical protein